MTTPYGMEREPRLRTLRYWAAERKLAITGWFAVAAIVLGGLGAWGAGAIDPSPLAQPATSFGVPGANLFEKGGTGTDVEVGAVGSGQTRTYIIRAKGAVGPQPLVIFLHGFGSSYIVGYEPWISHLAREGLTVVFPAWQEAPFPTDGSQDPRANMFEGVKLAVDAVPVQENRVAVLGFSAGGALAFDYAALGAKLDVPKPGLVYSIYPGRAFPGEQEVRLPQPPIGDVPATTRFVMLVSRKDKEAGTRWGKEQYAALAPRGDDLRELVYVTTPGLGDHYAPGDTDQKARRVFWKPFDTELSRHLGIALKPDMAVISATRAERAVSDAIERETVFRKKVYAGEKAKRPSQTYEQPLPLNP
ncbi:MAG: hypothetical protein PGN13_07610 [Patulibacter minatonensis]